MKVTSYNHGVQFSSFKMSVAMVNSSTVMGFIQDTKKFNNCINECFEMLDIDGNGMLSRELLYGGLHKLFVIGKQYEPRGRDQ